MPIRQKNHLLTNMPKAKKISYYQHKLDKLIQEIGRAVYKKCLVCGRPMSCLHHFYPKSMSETLRHDWENLIPVCQSCHFSHHNGNPDIHAAIIEIKGQDWLDGLKEKKKQITKRNIGAYKLKYKMLSASKIGL
jgi:5-methylcytosine-specific restriction endonuclease McrA